MLLLGQVASPILFRTRLTLRSKSKQRTAGYANAHYSYGKYRIRAHVNDLVFLGIETSSDDTGVAVVWSRSMEKQDNGSERVGNQQQTSHSRQWLAADLFTQYGGVVPKMAEEADAQVIDKVVEQAIHIAKLKPSDLTAVAVTIGPGLSLCLHRVMVALDWHRILPFRNV